MSTVYAVIPTFNRLNFTKKCLASFAAQKMRKLKIIVVDSGSTDGTQEYIKKNYPQVTLIQGNGDWWWTMATHQGIKYALKTAKSDDYILEMNNDCFFKHGYLKQLLKTAKKYPDAVIGSLCVSSRNKNLVVEAGVRIDWLTGVIYGVAPTISSKLSYFQKMKVVGDLDVLPGKGTLFPVKAIKKAGSVNYKKLPHYIADYEHTNRIKRKGFDLFVDTHAVINHVWEATGIAVKTRNETYGLKRMYEILFGRKSMNNIIDWITFLELSCPKRYKIRNYYFTFCRIMVVAFRVPPLSWIRPFLAPIPLLVYRIYLVINQTIGLKI